LRIFAQPSSSIPAGFLCGYNEIVEVVMRRAACLMPLLLAATAAIAQPREAAQGGQNVVVTGTRIQDFRDRLAACLARHCPVNEDVDATLALAETLFVAGDYRGARTAIRGSIGRNRRHAAAFPEPVSDLYRANSRVARHVGMDTEAQASAREVLYALQAGIPTEDYRHFTARLEIVQSEVAFGQYDAARRDLSRLAQLARAAGRNDVVAVTELRGLWIDYLQSPRGPVPSRLVELSRLTDPARRLSSVGAKILLIRIYSERDDTARANALIAELGRMGGRRQLLYNPPFELGVQAITPPGSSEGNALLQNVNSRIPLSYENKWIEVGYWVQPDGRVSDLEIVRRGRGSLGWETPLLDSIRGRRFSAGGDSTYRLERYTYTAGYETATGSHLSQRSPMARLEYFDLSGDQPERAQPLPPTGTNPAQ
jgi:hypothetical protein